MSQEGCQTSAEHRAASPKRLACAVVTVSDTRGEAEDKSGKFIRDALTAGNHDVVFYRIVRDEPAAIQNALTDAKLAGARAVLLNGGTGIAPRDQTPEALEALYEKKLDGFGEIFRVLSFQEIGPAGMLSRASAGVYQGMIIFSMPGSTNAVRLAMEKLVIPEIGHVVYELSKPGAASSTAR